MSAENNTSPNRIDEIQGQIVHIYDGIEEADNALPNWWLFIFWASIFFGGAYWYFYHEVDAGMSPMQAYAANLAASAGDEITEELLVATAANPDDVKAGAGVFDQNCVACHGPKASGFDAANKPAQGPNLTDNAWLHGGSPMQIFTTIAEGATGESVMPPWKASLGATKVKQVVAFILSIRDSNAAGKEPQGDVYDPNAAPSPAGDKAEAAPATAAKGAENAVIEGSDKAEDAVEEPAEAVAKGAEKNAGAAAAGTDNAADAAKAAHEATKKTTEKAKALVPGQ